MSIPRRQRLLSVWFPDLVSMERNPSALRGIATRAGPLVGRERKELMNKKTRITIFATAVALLAAGWLAGGANSVVEAQSDNPFVGQDWRMFSQNVGGAGQSIVGRPGLAWLYNMRTGKVYRLYRECGDDPEGASGCLVSLPVFSADRLSDYVPSPVTEVGPGREL